MGSYYSCIIIIAVSVMCSCSHTTKNRPPATIQHTLGMHNNNDHNSRLLYSF